MSWARDLHTSHTHRHALPWVRRFRAGILHERRTGQREQLLRLKRIYSACIYRCPSRHPRANLCRGTVLLGAAVAVLARSGAVVAGDGATGAAALPVVLWHGACNNRLRRPCVWPHNAPHAHTSLSATFWRQGKRYGLESCPWCTHTSLHLLLILWYTLVYAVVPHCAHVVL